VPGAEVARGLRVPLDLIIAQKIRHPYKPGRTIGAVTEAGDPVIDRLEAVSVPDEWLHCCITAGRQEARRRRERYAGGRAPLLAAGRLAIVVDDGIATGLTMEAAIRELQGHRPARLVVAAAVASADSVRRLMNEADDVVVLRIAEDYREAADACYEYFPPVPDQAVIALLREAESALSAVETDTGGT